ncbi:MAG: phosphoribosylamine--glycine ligase [Thermoplasmatota archaeon]
MVSKVLLVGGGAREHAIATAVTRSGGQLYGWLKNRNPGILRLAKDVRIGSETAAKDIAEAAKSWGIDIGVLGMDAAVAAAVADALQEAGIPCASPSRAAGEIEWSKTFMRNLLERHDIPGRIAWRSFREPTSEIDSWVRQCGGQVAVKPVGLTGGKGVKVTGDHLASAEEAVQYANEVLRTGFGGTEVLIEEKLEGEEFSIQAFCDGTSAVRMPAVQDHKRALEGDVGPNTGGMGSYSDANHLLPFLEASDVETGTDIMRKIVRALSSVGRPYVGTMYGQFMLTSKGVRVIEINARFGDPEAMNVLETLESDYVEILHSMPEGRLAATKVSFAKDATVCKYVVPEGYGTQPAANEPVFVDEAGARAEGGVVYYASVNETPQGLRTTTSRSVAMVARGPTLEEANAKVEKALAFVRGPKLYVRHDVGTPSLIAQRVAHVRTIRARAATDGPSRAQKAPKPPPA